VIAPLLVQGCNHDIVLYRDFFALTGGHRSS
jgi:hypothetical protein